MATTTTLEIDVRIETVINGTVYFADNRFDFETDSDFDSFLEEKKEELIEQLCSFYEEEENFEELEETLKNAEYELTYEVKNWGEVSEYKNLQDIEILNDIVNEGIDYDFDVISAALDCDVQLSDIEESYSGEFEDNEDFAYDMAKQTGAIDKHASWPMNCIDWTYAAKELMYDYSESNGYYFRML